MRRVGCTPRTVSWKAFERKQTDTRSVRSLSLQGGSGSMQCQVPLRSRRTGVQVGSCPRKKERSGSSEFALQAGRVGGRYGALEQLSAPVPVGCRGLGHHGHQMLPGGFPSDSSPEEREESFMFLNIKLQEEKLTHWVCS